MHPIIQQPSDRQLSMTPGLRTQHAGVASAGGVESAYCVGFDGTNDYVSVPSDPLGTNYTSYTLCLWMRTTQTTEAVMVARSSGVASSVIEFGHSIITQGKLIFDDYLPSGGWLESQRSVNDGLWHFVVAVRDGSTRRIYIDGRLDTQSNAESFGGAQPTRLTLGVDWRDAFTRWYRGDMDDVRIYNRALTAAEVASIYANIASPPTDGLVAYFSLDEGTGTTTTDTVGGLVGTLTPNPNGPTWQPQVCPRLRSGRGTDESWGVSFDGTDDYVDFGNVGVMDFGSGPFTIAFWVKWTETSSGPFVAKDNWAGASGGVTIYQNSASPGRIAYWVTGVSVEYLAGTGLNDGQWHHYAVCRSGTGANQLAFYVDGRQVATGTDARTITNSRSFRIGATSDTIEFLAFLIKSLRIYNSALSADDIAKLANNVPIAATPVGHWKLDDGTEITATDSSDNGNHGTLTNGPTWTGDIPQWFRPAIESSYAGSFDGTDDWINIPSSLEWDFNDFTMMLWFNPASSGDDALLGRWATPNGGWVLNYYHSGNGVRFDYANAVICQSGTAVALATWHHGAISRINTSVNLYVDGSNKASATLSGTLNKQTGVGFAIGRYSTTENSEYFTGLIDEVCIYNRALTAAEILDASLGYLVPAGLVSRWKLDGNANDAVGSNHGTEQGGVSYSVSVPGTL